MDIGRDIVNIISQLLHVIIIKWWIIKLLKTMSLWANYMESITEMYIASTLCVVALWDWEHWLLDYRHFTVDDIKSNTLH